MDRRIAVIAGWLAVSITVVVRAPLDAGSAPGQVTRTGVIAGTVTTDSGVPIARARVTLSSAGARSTITDDRGAFAFTNLAADEYTLSASRTGYLDVVYGQRRPGNGRPGTPIRLTSGQRFDRITLQMARGGVITGVVIDDNGEPAIAVPVRAYRWTIRAGEPSLVSASFDQTDDRGVYRIPFLQPGDYVVAASPRNDVESLQQVIETSTPAALGSLTRSAGSARAAAYAPVFHPGTTRVSEAAAVKVDINEERSGVNIPLQRVTMGPISGTVISSGGGPHPGAHVTLIDSPQWLTSVGTRSVRAGSTGQFVFNDVPPGLHTLIGRTEGNQPLWGRVEIATDGRDGSVLLTLQRGLNVSGVVTFADAPSASGPGGIRLSLAAMGSASLEAAVTTTVQRNGTFQFRGVPPGRYQLTAAPLPAGHSLQSATFGGRDVLDSLLEVKPNEDLEGVVTISPRSSEIAGLLQDSAGQASSDYTIVAFAADARYWTPRSRRIQATRPSTDGRFALQGLPAGTYRLVAITDAEPGQWFDPSFLQQLTADSRLVSVAEGERKVQDLRLKSK